MPPALCVRTVRPLGMVGHALTASARGDVESHVTFTMRNVWR